MNKLTSFLCDWGSPDSNMLLFFLLISFLLGLLAGWLIWGLKIQALLQQLKQKDTTIADFNAKLLMKEEEYNKASKSNEELILKNRQLGEEKGQLYADLSTCTGEKESFIGHFNTLNAEKIALQAEIDRLNAAAVQQPIAMAASIPTTEEVSEPAAEVVATPIVPDDLKIVEGIGPKIEGLLNAANIYTFKQLSETSNEHLRSILDEAGRRYQIHDPSTWARQALLAYEGKWEELQVWQDALKGGKE